MQVQGDGATFNCRIEGVDGAPWVTLVHGIATDLSLWDEFAVGLSPQYRILRFDVRGHGASSASEGDYTLKLLARDVICILDALDIRNTHFVGLSMGGMIGLGLTLDHAARLLSATICDARANATDDYRDAWSKRIQSVRQNGIDAIVESTVTRWFTPAFQANEPDRMNWMRSMIRRTSVAGYAGCGAALKDLDYGSRLHEIRVPIFYVVGSDDQGAPASVMWDMHKTTPDSHFVEIPDAGHISNVEQPSLFNAAVAGFLRGFR